MAILKNPSRKKFTVVDNHALRDDNLSLKARGLLVTMLSLPNNWKFSENGLCALFKKDGQASIRSGLKELESSGYLVRRRTRDDMGRVDGVEWIIYDPPRLENRNVDNPSLDSQPQLNTKELSTDLLSTEYNITPSNPPMGEDGQPQTAAKSKPPKRKKASPKEDYDLEGFNAFYAAYPRHEGKAAALKAWNKLAPDVVLQEQMGKALEVQKKSPQWTKNNGQYIPMPATWLNGRRWEDEAPQAQSQESQFDRMMAWAKEFDEKHGSV